MWDLPGRKGGDYKYCLSVVHQGVVSVWGAGKKDSSAATHRSHATVTMPRAQIKDIKILQDHRSERLYVEFDVSRKFRDLDSLVARFRYSERSCLMINPHISTFHLLEPLNRPGPPPHPSPEGGSDVIPCALTGPIVFGSLDGRRALRA